MLDTYFIGVHGGMVKKKTQAKASGPSKTAAKSKKSLQLASISHSLEVASKAPVVISSANEQASHPV